MSKYLNSTGFTYFINKLKVLMDGKANTNHAHNIIKDSNDASDISIAYSKGALEYSDYTSLAAWNGRELRAVDKSNYYNRSEIDAKIKNITGGGTVLAQSLTIALNGGTTEGTNKFTFDGSLTKNINITADSIGSIPWKITNADRCIEGVLYVGDTFNSNVKDGRISVRKNSTIDFKSSYLNFNDAFYSAYTAQEYALILLTQGIVKNDSGKCEVQGNLGIHQHNGALYVGCQNVDKKKNFCQIKLLGMDATSDFALTSQLNNYVPTSRLRYLRPAETSDKINLHYYADTVTNKEKWNDYLLPASTLAYWDGSFNDVHASSLRYCEKGAFGNAACKTTRSLTGEGPCGWVDQATDDKFVPTMSLLAFWDGSHSTSKTDSNVHYSSLTYCKMGKFGSAVTRNISHGTGTPPNSANEGDIYIQL